MPNRILRDTTDSDRVNSLSLMGEVFFYRLMMKADDHGGFFGSPAILKAQLFPLRSDSVREADVSRCIDECRKAGLIVFYEVKSKPYIRIIDFGQRLRTMKSKFPRTPDRDLPTNVRNSPTNDSLNRIETETEENPEGKAPAVNFNPKNHGETETHENGDGFNHSQPGEENPGEEKHGSKTQGNAKGLPIPPPHTLHHAEFWRARLNENTVMARRRAIKGRWPEATDFQIAILETNYDPYFDNRYPNGATMQDYARSFNWFINDQKDLPKVNGSAIISPAPTLKKLN